MKKTLRVVITLFTFLFLTNCSKEEDPVVAPVAVIQNFVFDGVTYNLNGQDNIIEDKRVFTENGITYNESAFAISGNSADGKKAVVSFNCVFKIGLSLDGTYKFLYSADNSVPGFEAFINLNGRGILGYFSYANIYPGNQQPSIFRCNNPSDPIKITVNSPDIYTFELNSNFKLVDNSNNFVRNVPILMNIKHKVFIF